MSKLITLLLVVIPLFSFSQESLSKATTSEDSMFDIRRNAIYNEDILAFSYDRVLPVSKKFGFLLKGGFLIWDPLMPLVEGGMIFGKYKHFFEAGVGALLAVTNDDEEGGFDFLTFRIGYRYQAPKGFLFKASGIYSPDNFILPLFALGYAF